MAERRDPHRFDDLFEHFGPVTARRMFGGEGLFSGEIMIGIAGDGDELFLKTDENTRPAYVEEGGRQFVFHMRSRPGEIALTSYYSVPARLYDDPEELAPWAKQANEIASQTETAKRKQRKRLRETTATSSSRTRSRVLRAARRRTRR
jgi:DNA transformation protein and related proteins